MSSIYYDVYTSVDTELISEIEQIKYLTNDVLLPLPEEEEIHEEGNSQITEVVYSRISEEICKVT